MNVNGWCTGGAHTFTTPCACNVRDKREDQEHGHTAAGGKQHLHHLPSKSSIDLSSQSPTYFLPFTRSISHSTSCFSHSHSCSPQDHTTTFNQKDNIALEPHNMDPMDSSYAYLDHHTTLTLKKGPWTSAEDAILISYVQKHGEGNWNAVQKHSGLSRCGKSCRLRWANHLRPNLKKGAFTQEEERIIIELHQKLGNKWARMTAQLPGRTDNEIKNYWNTRIKRRMRAGLPVYPIDMQTQPSNGQQYAHAERSGVEKINNGNVMARSSTGKVVQSKSNLERQGFNFTNLVGGCHFRLSNCTLRPSLSSTELPHNSTNIAGNPIRRGKRERDESKDENSLQSNVKPGRNCLRDFLRIPEQSYAFEDDCRPPFSVPYFEGLANGDHTLVSISDHRHLIPRPDAQGLKLELPSSQFAESAGSTETPRSAVTSPYSVTNVSNHLLSEPDSFGSTNNNFLEALLLQEAQTGERIHHLRSDLVDQLLMLASNIHSLDIDPILIDSEKNEWTKAGSVTPVGDHSILSTFDVEHQQQWEVPIILRPHVSGNCVKFESNTCTEMPVATYSDEELSILLDFAKQETTDVPEWYNPNTGVATADRTAILVPTSADHDSFEPQGAPVDLEQLLSGHVRVNEIWELGSCQWNNMPGACQMGELAAECRALPTIAEAYNDSCVIY